MSGMIMDALDHVRIITLLPLRCAALTFWASLASTYGPFLMDLDMQRPLYRLFLREKIILSDFLFFRVR